MLSALKQWFRRSPSTQTQDDERSLVIEGQIQNLRLELAERNQLVDKLKQELERQRNSESNRLTTAIQTQVEQLLTDAAAPVTQLFTQAHLLSQGTPVQAKDVLAVAKRLIGVLEDNGLTLTGSVGETVSSSLTPERPVVVKFLSVSYQGKVIRKAGVEPCQDV